MVTAEVPAKTALTCRTVHYVLSRAVVVVRVAVSDLAAVVAWVYQIEVRGGYVEGRITEVSGYRESLQEHLRAYDRRAEVQETPPSSSATDAHILLKSIPEHFPITDISQVGC